MIYRANQRDGFHKMTTLDWKKLILTTTFVIYNFSPFIKKFFSPFSGCPFSPFSYFSQNCNHQECKLKMLFWILIKLIFIPILIWWHCVKVWKYAFFSGPLPVFSPNAEKYGPDKTPYLNTFHTVWKKTAGT